MNVLSSIGLMTKSEGANIARALMIGNDLDFDKAVENVFKKVQAYTKTADDKRADYVKRNALAETARLNASNAAADEFAKATGSKVDTASLRRAAAVLMSATNWFEKWDFTGLSAKYLNEVLKFAGIDADVLTKMKNAAATKIAEAQRLEKEAADALVAANTAYANAEGKVADEFQKAVAATQPLLAEAIKFEDLAKSLMAAYTVLSSAK